MSPIAIALDLLLAGLLVLALMIGVRLNRRLKTLRESHAAFAQAVTELNQAAARAQAGLASLRATSEEVHDSLLNRIETARALIAKLERAMVEADKAAQAPQPIGVPPSLAAFSSSRPVLNREPAQAAPAKPASPLRPAGQPKRRPATDEDLFVKGGWDADSDFAPSTRKRGDSR